MTTEEGDQLDWDRAGEAVIDERAARHWTQAKLAAEADLDVSVIQDIELGRGGGRARSSLTRVARAFGWERDQIQRIAAGENPPWQVEGAQMAALETQESALAEQVTMLLGGLNDLAALVDRLSQRVDQLSQRVARLDPRGE